MNRTRRKNNKNGSTKATTTKETGSPKKAQNATSKSVKNVDKKKANAVTPNDPASVTVPVVVEKPPNPAQLRQAPIAAPPKLSRANTFFITRKISKLYSTLTGSKTSLNNIPENESDSVQMRSDGTSIDSSKAARPKSMQSIGNPFKFVRSASMAVIPLRRNQSPDKKTANRPLSFDEVDNATAKEMHRSNGSDLNLAQDIQRKTVTPSFLSSLKRTFSVTAAKRKSHNSRWSSSLLNLQQIDVMVSYENLSFIDYDKFNTYEEKILQRVNQPKDQHTLSQPDESHIHSEKYPQVKRRMNKPSVIQSADTNFDKRKNLYRQSIDDRKLQILNDLNRPMSYFEVPATPPSLPRLCRPASDGFYSQATLTPRRAHSLSDTLTVPGYVQVSVHINYMFSFL